MIAIRLLFAAGLAAAGFAWLAEAERGQLAAFTAGLARLGEQQAAWTARGDAARDVFMARHRYQH